MGFEYTVFKTRKPKCVICFKIILNKDLKLLKLKRYIRRTHYKNPNFLENKKQELKRNIKFIKKTSTACINKNAIKKYFAVLFYLLGYKKTFTQYCI